MHICTCQCLLLSNPTRSFFATLTEQRMTVLHGLGGSRGLGGDMAVWHGGNRCGEWWGGRKVNGGEGESRGVHHGWHGCWGLGGFGCGSLGREGASF